MSLDLFFQKHSESSYEYFVFSESKQAFHVNILVSDSLLWKNPFDKHSLSCRVRNVRMVHKCNGLFQVRFWCIRNCLNVLN